MASVAKAAKMPQNISHKARGPKKKALAAIRGTAAISTSNMRQCAVSPFLM
jgi:hypothetical protein